MSDLLRTTVERWMQFEPTNVSATYSKRVSTSNSPVKRIININVCLSNKTTPFPRDERVSNLCRREDFENELKSDSND